MPEVPSSPPAAPRHGVTLHNPSRRRSVFGVCTVMAVLLNGSILAIGDRMSGASVRPAAGVTDSRSRVLLVAPPREPTQDLPVTTQPAPVNTAQAASTRPRDPPQTRAKTGREMTSPAPIRFYRFTEVDTSAEPESGDWNIEPEALAKLGLQRMVFEILISDRGQVLGCTILDPPALAETIRRELEGQLSATRMRPAIRAGMLRPRRGDTGTTAPAAHPPQYTVGRITAVSRAYLVQMPSKFVHTIRHPDNCSCAHVPCRPRLAPSHGRASSGFGRFHADRSDDHSRHRGHPRIDSAAELP